MVLAILAHIFSGLPLLVKCRQSLNMAVWLLKLAAGRSYTPFKPERPNHCRTLSMHTLAKLEYACMPQFMHPLSSRISSSQRPRRSKTFVQMCWMYLVAQQWSGFPHALSVPCSAAIMRTVTDTYVYVQT